MCSEGVFAKIKAERTTLVGVVQTILIHRKSS